MTSYRYIGKGKTDSNGIAHITTDANGNNISSNPGYTGVGAGVINVIASLDNPIDDSSVVSETCSVWDYLFYDSGTTGTPNSMWNTNNSTYASISSTDNGLVLSNTNTSSAYYIGINKGSSSAQITDWIDWKDFVFEFEMVKRVGDCSFNLRPESSTAIVYYVSNLNVGDIFRAEYTNGVAKLFKNGTQIGSDYQFNVDELTSIRFTIGKEKSITIKNVKLYSI